MLSRKVKAILITLLISLSVASFMIFARGTLEPKLEAQVWKMHKIDNPGLPLPNGLTQADVNKDGFPDYLTNYEWDGALRIAFHPGLERVDESWPAVTVGSVANAESSALGDFDGDGNFDVVVAHGAEMLAHSGVLFIWGPPANRTAEGSAWLKSEDIPDTTDKGQFHFVRGLDFNGDGITDVCVGGRGTNPKAGLKWIEAPSDSSDRRNVTAWEVHDIDPSLESGHGFVFGDVDQDGDADIALCNSDFDTPDSEERVAWYENPGTDSTAQRNPWLRHVIYSGSEFYTKEQVVLRDLTNDSYPELVMQTETALYLFENPGGDTNSTWRLTAYPKPQETNWRSRAIGIGDMNSDGQPDLIGMLIHRGGLLPIDKAAVFWMEYSGTPFTGNWTTHPVKWGDGYVGFTGFGEINGEKWDLFILDDVDRDGDLDIVADCEEYNFLGFVYIAVVWFENPLLP